MPFSKVAQERLLSLFENHTRSLGYALAAVIESQPKDLSELRSTLQAAMDTTYLACEGQNASRADITTATSPFMWLIAGVEDFGSDAQQFDSLG